MPSLGQKQIDPTRTVTLTAFPVGATTYQYATYADGTIATCELDGTLDTRPAGTPIGDFQLFLTEGNAAIYQPGRTQIGPMAPTFAFLLFHRPRVPTR